MEFTTFLVTMFCLGDDWLRGQRIRQRGPQPALSDSEVLTMEILGEFLRIDTDKGLFEFFRCHYGDWFPALRTIHRTTFVRQAANGFRSSIRFRYQCAVSRVPNDVADCERLRRMGMTT